MFAVDFRATDRGALESLDGVIVFGSDTELPPVAAPILRFEDCDSAASRLLPVGRTVELAVSERVDSRLRGRRLEERTPIEAPRLEDGIPLARDDRGPIWVDRSGTQDLEVSLLAPRELDPHEPLRDLCQSGSFIALLPLVHLLRRVTGYAEWTRPGPRAAFVFDDPNLHWPSYGYIHFAQLARHAVEHGYHAAMAMVPLDAWFAHPRAVQAFRAHGDQLSLALHGNDHTYCELDATHPLEVGVSLFEQAVRRARRFERSTGLVLDRVMIPPHGLCSDAMVEAMPGAGLEALCRSPDWSRRWPTAARQASRWRMADISPAGMPIMDRHLLTHMQRDQITIDLFLDRPAVVYGHHRDLQGGYGLLADVAGWLNGFDGLEWGSLQQLARTNVASRRAGDRLRVCAYSRRSSVDVESGVTAVDIELPAYERWSEDTLFVNGRAQELSVSDGVVRASAVVGGERTLELVVCRRPIENSRLRPARPRAIVRRGATEMRDRLQPALFNTHLHAALARLERIAVKRRTAVGPFVLDLVTREGLGASLGELGLLLLVFIAGLELD